MTPTIGIATISCPARHFRAGKRRGKFHLLRRSKNCAHRAKLQFSLAVEPLALSWPAFDGLPAPLQTPASLGRRRIDLDSRRHIAKRHGADPRWWSFTPQVDSAGH